MIILDTTAKSLRAKLAGAVSANQPIFTVAYADTDGATFTEGSNEGTFNSTTEVTLLAAPASGHRRIIKSISIYNADTANVTYSLYMLVTAAVQIIEKRTLTTLSSKLYGFDAAVNPFDQDLFTGSSPAFAGLTIGSLAGFLFGTAGVVSAKAVGYVLPQMIDIDVYPTAQANTNWDTNNMDGSNSIYGAQKTSSGAQNDEINWTVILAPGTWTLELMHVTYTDRGIYTVQFNSSTVGTIDGYSAGVVRNVRSSITGISVVSLGTTQVKLKMATKGSGTSYVGCIQHIRLQQTA
jgi:hypothetical protein